MAATNKHKQFLAFQSKSILLELKDFYRLKEAIWRAHFLK